MPPLGCPSQLCLLPAEQYLWNIIQNLSCTDHIKFLNCESRFRYRATQSAAAPVCQVIEAILIDYFLYKKVFWSFIPILGALLLKIEINKFWKFRLIALNCLLWESLYLSSKKSLWVYRTAFVLTLFSKLVNVLCSSIRTRFRMLSADVRVRNAYH